MPRSRKFQPPKVSDPPILVEVEWVDAVYEDAHDGPADKAGGLALLPSCGYHVRNGKGDHGPFIVLAREWSHGDNGGLNSRHHISIPTGWITRWTVVTGKRQVWPESPESDTSTSSTKRPRTKKDTSEPTNSGTETSAGVSPSASTPAEQSS